MSLRQDLWSLMQEPRTAKHSLATEVGAVSACASTLKELVDPACRNPNSRGWAVPFALHLASWTNRYLRSVILSLYRKLGIGIDVDFSHYI